MSRSFVRNATLGAVCVTALMAWVAVAGAGAAVDLGPGDERPSMAYDATTGTTYVAWQANDLAGIDLCVVPSGGAACSPGTIDLVDTTVGASGVVYSSPQVTIEPGGSVVVSANVDGAKGGIPGGYPGEGTVAWSSGPGGAAFAGAGQGLADGGDLLAPKLSPGAGAAALGGSPLELAVFGYSPLGNAFSAFSLAASAPATPVKDSTEDFGNDLDANSGQVAALQNTPSPGEDLVVLVGGGLFNSFSECPGSERHTGFAAAKGSLANLNKQASWSPFKALDCNAQGPVVAGGASGIGVLEDEGTGIEGSGGDSIDYRSFNTATMQFNAPVAISDETSSSILGADGLSVSQDSAGAIYAMWSDERGLDMSYSTTGGATWATPITVPGTSLGSPVIAGVGGGAFEVAYTTNPGGGHQEFLEPFNYATLFAAEHAPPIVTAPVATPQPTPVVKPAATTISSTTQFEGETVGLSVPNQCVKDGKVVGTLTFKLPSHKRKGKVVVKIYKVVFKVGTVSQTITRKKLINKPFVAKLQIKHPRAGSKYVLTARAFIAVKHGKPRSKTLKVILTTCA